MKSQLIVTFLGAEKRGILSEIAKTVGHANCNILDSRQAVYGKDFSLTMIIEGTGASISKAEYLIPLLCQHHDLLSMMKRTSHHEKQNLECLYDVEFSGVDASGVMNSVTNFFTERNINISAFRQKTFPDSATSKPMMKCKMVLSLSKDVDIDELSLSLENLFESLNLKGILKDTHNKEQHENASSWG